ncbi:MAG: hypothetical protein EXX96DRAFT_566712 [Benjaminiella poitrasii]|nr:MAG: hypothetical protein EXX96DRAFT_566712 [Benjaminiella poitrasii]
MFRLLLQRNASLQKMAVVRSFTMKHSMSSVKSTIAISSCNSNIMNNKRHNYSHPFLPLTTLSLRNQRSVQQSVQRMPIRSMSLWKLPFVLIRVLPFKRRLGLITLGGLGLATAIVLGPFVLVGLGGLVTFGIYRIWRIKRNLLRQQPLQQNWTDVFRDQSPSSFVNNIIFGREQFQVESEAIRYFNNWVQSDIGQDELMKQGIHLDAITSQSVSMRGSSYSTVSTLNDSIIEIKIELARKCADCHWRIGQDKKVGHERYSASDSFQSCCTHSSFFHC